MHALLGCVSRQGTASRAGSVRHPAPGPEHESAALARPVELGDRDAIGAGVAVERVMLDLAALQQLVARGAMPEEGAIAPRADRRRQDLANRCTRSSVSTAPSTRSAMIRAAGRVSVSMPPIWPAGLK